MLPRVRPLLREIGCRQLELIELAPDLMCIVVGDADDEAECSSDGRPALTEAERAVVTLVLRGLSNESIAKDRRASVSTVANQLTSVYKKLGVGGRRELVAHYSEPEMKRRRRAGS